MKTPRPQQTTFLAATLALSLCAQCTLTACSSTPKVVSLDGTAPQAVSDNSDYVVRGRYPAKTPAWAEDFESFKRANDSKGTTYFLGESGDVNDRLAGCELATLMAKRHIAEQIAQLVTSRIGAGQAGVLSTDKDAHSGGGLGSDFQNTVAAVSYAFLTGVQEYGKAWEERDYSGTGGRKRVYLCQSVVTIDDAHLKEAIHRTSRKMGAKLSDPIARANVNSAFKKLDPEDKSSRSAAQSAEVSEVSGTSDDESDEE